MNNSRIQQIDILRAVIMIIMSLDHFIYFIVRFHPGEFWNVPAPVFPQDFLFWFRLLSHLCAPGFVYLAGVSIKLSYERKIDRGITHSTARNTLLKRGGFLLMLQLFLEPLAWALGFFGGRGIPLNEIIVPGVGTGVIYLGVIYAISLSSILAALLIRLPKRFFIVSGFLLIFLSPVIIRLFPDPQQQIPWLAGIFAVPGNAPPFYVNYPLVPWIGLFFIGVATGDRRTLEMLNWKGSKRFALLPISGLIIFAAVLLRIWQPFGESRSFENTLMSFFSLSKYPPSPAFLFLSIGVSGLIMVFIQQLRLQESVLTRLGRQPLFFYFFHLFFYGALSFLFILDANFLTVTIVWLLTLPVLVYGTLVYESHLRPLLRRKGGKKEHNGI